MISDGRAIALAVTGEGLEMWGRRVVGVQEITAVRTTGDRLDESTRKIHSVFVFTVITDQPKKG